MEEIKQATSVRSKARSCNSVEDSADLGLRAAGEARKSAAKSPVVYAVSVAAGLSASALQGIVAGRRRRAKDSALQGSEWDLVPAAQVPQWTRLGARLAAAATTAAAATSGAAATTAAATPAIVDGDTSVARGAGSSAGSGGGSSSASGVPPGGAAATRSAVGSPSLRPSHCSAAQVDRSCTSTV